MDTTYIGQTKLIRFGGRLFKHCDESAHFVSDAEWANKILANPPVVYPNGRNSHEVAGEILERAEDGLIDFLRVVA